MVMKTLFTILFFGISGLVVHAQQTPLFTQYFWNDYLINPAFSGLSSYNPIQVGVRNQWTGFGGAPGTYTLGGHGAIQNKNMGIGGMLFLDDFGGAIEQSGIVLNYAYHLKLNNSSKLSMGISGSLNQYTYDGSNIIANSQNDQSLFVSQKSLVPDFNLGIVYSSEDRLRVGFSANQLLESSLKKWNSNTSEELSNKLVRHYFLSGSYLADIKGKIQLEPYTVLRTTFITPVQFEMGARIIYKEHFYTGIGYRHKDAFVFLVGTTYNRFLLGYSYDLTTSKLRNYSSGSHEIMIGYRLAQRKASSAPKE